MVKGSKNMRSQLETGNIGCMWGLIRMLHFHRDPKLLLRQRQSNTQYFTNRCSRSQPSEIDEINEEYDSDEEIKPTVKKLMEEEMKGKIVKRKKSSDEIERILSDWGQPEKKKSKQKRHKSKPNPNPNSTESSDLELVLAAFLIEIYRYHNECQHLDCKNKTGLLCPTLKSIVYSKLHDRNNNNNNSDNNSDTFGNNLRASQSKEFTNALEILSSNKELFLKILQDPDSRVLEKIQEINSRREEKRSFFKRKEQQEGKTDISQRTMSKIVVLKPKATTKASSSYDEKFVSFSFKEIKRRLKRIIGENSKERNNLSTSLDGIRKDTNLFKIVTGTNNNNNLYRPVPVRTAGSSFYEEAKKHLAELLENGNKDDIKKKHDSKPLGKLISFKEGNLQKCPDLEPCEDRELEKEESLSNGEILNEVELERDNCIEENENESKNERSVLEIQHETQNEEVLDEGSEHTEEPKSDECIIPSEPSTQDPEQESTEEPESETVEEVIEEFVASPKFVNEPSTSCSENMDQPSPISVLDKIFCVEVSSVDCKVLNYDDVHESPSHPCSNQMPLLEDTNARFEFIKLVLQASELCKKESLERWYISDELLEPSLFDQLEIDFDQGEDSRLLFDCINEVLIGIQKRRYGFTPSVRVRCNVLNEVCKEVNKNVEDKELSFLERDWVDVREENEGIVTEIWDELIDDLLEETVFDLWL
ncbi:hypothetical protein LUZ60_014483 [Juncus effusus]|nr:hypothetical protein LUZ60_014483 [Juncus effusus]